MYSNVGSQIPSTTDRDNCQKLIRDKLGQARWGLSRKLKLKLPGLESKSGLQQTWIKLGHDSDTGLYLWGSNPAWAKTKINMRTESFRDSIQQICDTPLERSVTINGIQYQVNHCRCCLLKHFIFCVSIYIPTDICSSGCVPGWSSAG